jgi:hypothetical protein
MAVAGIPLVMGDGNTYVIAPLTLGAIEDMQGAIGDVGGELSPAAIKAIVDVTHASLKRNYPEMTRNEARELVDIGNMMAVFEACMDVSGMKRKALEEGEAPGEASA